MRWQISLPGSPPALDFIRNSSVGTRLIGPAGAVEEIMNSVFRGGVGTSATGAGRPVEMRLSHPAPTKPDGIASTGCCIGPKPPWRPIGALGATIGDILDTLVAKTGPGMAA